MPVKWKIFFALNLVLSFLALFCLIVFIARIANTYSGEKHPPYSFITVFLIALLIILLNGLLNIHILQRFYPDKLFAKGAKLLNSILTVLNIIVNIGFLLVCIYGASEELGEKGNRAGRIGLGLFFFLWLLQLAVLIMQMQLAGRIKRNNRESINSLIDSIGQKNPD